MATETKKIGGAKFTKKSCSKSKTEANKGASALRAKGKKARVIKSGTSYCVFEGSARKKTGGRKKK